MEAALVILDGWGIADHDRRNAIVAADTPTVEALTDAGAAGTLDPAGRRVGLPDGMSGNSEVGHLHIGAGRVVLQALTRINEAIETSHFRHTAALSRAIETAAESDRRVHFIGLLSTGGVHADVGHLTALIEWAADLEVEAVSHVFTDGRDMPPRSAHELIGPIEATSADLDTGHVGSICGRYFGMDRDGNWDRTAAAYHLIVDGISEHRAATPSAAIERAYERGETDEFIEPTTIDGVPTVESGDAVVLFNFRGDRARQLTRLLGNLGDAGPVEVDPPRITLVTMTEYDRRFSIPAAFDPPTVENTLGEVLADTGRTQLRIAESEKYAHVTYFLNGGRETTFPGELRRIIRSPDVPTYDRQPEMSAAEVTSTAIAVIESDDPDVLILNYANPDMVGHTGDFDAAIRAVEAVDTQLGRLVESVADREAHLLVTADHGNAEDMGTADDPHTAHTANPVPVIYRAPTGGRGSHRIRPGGSLADLAPTLFDVLRIDPPDEMTGRSLLRD